MSFLIEYQKKVSDLQRRVSELGMKVTQKWKKMPTVATGDCDVVATFSASTSESSITWLVGLLAERIPQLEVSHHHHKISKQSALYLTSDCRSLLLAAEELKIQKLLVEFGGGIREFCVDDLELFQGSDNLNTFLTSSERCRIVHHLLMSLRACKEDVYDDSLQFTEGQLIISQLKTAGIITQIYPIHQAEDLDRLKEDWVRGWTLYQPLDAIQEYFGVHIALYFAWLGHYTASLIIPAVLGFCVWLLVDLKGDTFYHLLLAIFGLGWSSIYLEHWKRTSANLTYRWGTLDSPPSLLEEARAAFKGRLTLCPITKRLVRTYPSWRRKMTYCLVTAPIILFSLFSVVLITLGFVWMQDRTDDWIAEDKDPLTGSISLPMMLLMHIPKVFLALFIFLMNFVYLKVATWLTNFENHRLDVDYHSHLVGKLLLLQFMNSFFSLFYTAFYLQDLNMLQQQLTTLLLTRQILGNLKEVFVPYGESRIRQALLSLKYNRSKRAHSAISSLRQSSTESADLDRATEDSQVETLGTAVTEDPDSQTRKRSDHTSERKVSRLAYMASAERESNLLRYDGPDEDFLEIFIQFSYVSMFSCVFPVAGLLALCNNLVEIRGDAFKLITSYQRPFSQSAGSIGIWQVAMEMVGYAAVVVNIGLLHVCGVAQRLFPNLSSLQLLLLLVFLEHAFFILRYMLSSLISDTPSAVLQQIAELEHRRREALRTIERDSMRQRRCRSRSISGNKTE